MRRLGRALRRRASLHLGPKGKAGLYSFAVLSVAAFILHTQYTVNELRENAKVVAETYAKIIAATASDVTYDREVDAVFDEIDRKTDFPMIMTDASTGEPKFWRGLGPLQHEDSPSAQRGRRQLARKFDRENDPIPFKVKSLNRTLTATLHYGDSPLIARLRWLPYVEVGVIALCILVGFLGFRNIKNAEQRLLWIGMAKETAHQMGTPLSSLYGWLEILRARLGDLPGSANGVAGAAVPVLDDMEHDLERLSRVAARFNRIGSVPEVEPSALDAVLVGTVEYFKARLPRRGGSVTIDVHCEPLPPVAINRELLSWAFENIVKNAVDAVDGHRGRIEVSAGLAQDGRHARIDFRDNGRGMSVKDQKYIFEPGRTTKQHGWGLGLTLARRIIEEYHDGHIFVFDSKRDVGTTIEVLLPIHSAA